MPSLRDIRRRIASVKNTQQITNAMKMVSAAKLQRAQDRVLAARPYSQRLRQVLEHLDARVRPDIHPLLTPRDSGKTAAGAGDVGPRPVRRLQRQRAARRRRVAARAGRQ